MAGEAAIVNAAEASADDDALADVTCASSLSCCPTGVAGSTTASTVIAGRAPTGADAPR
ncbi:unannotated protein [freshwater metagenome]|uniref:Unannotated protein n=1 Tax=freshwater metagenome TaxID=449393 RepID=A0A6J6PEV5_9ZZZZ